MLKNKNILLAVTGSISAYKSADLCSQFVKLGANVKVVMTSSAVKFISPLTFEALTSHKVFIDDFDIDKKITHIELARWFDFLVIYPATAQTLNSLSLGIGHELLNSIFLALNFPFDTKKIYIAPAMNTAMLKHPATNASIQKLQTWGCNVLPTDNGKLACGESGDGKLISPESLINKLSEIENIETKSKIPMQKVLVTFGGNTEPIDGVRYISNFSTGKTGRNIVDLLSEDKKLNVFYLKSSRAENPQSKNGLTFDSYESLVNLLKKELKNSYDYVIHLAAVSDFSISSLTVDEKKFSPPINFKIKSNSKVQIELKTNPKIISEIKKWSINPNIKLIGFKLTNNDPSNADSIKKILNEGADYVVHNELSEINNQEHAFSIYKKEGYLSSGKNKEELCNQIKNIIYSNPISKEAKL